MKLTLSSTGRDPADCKDPASAVASTGAQEKETGGLSVDQHTQLLKLIKDGADMKVIFDALPDVSREKVIKHILYIEHGLQMQICKRRVGSDKFELMDLLRKLKIGSKNSSVRHYLKKEVP